MGNNLEKKLVTVLLLVVIFVGSIWSDVYKYVDEIMFSVFGDVKTEWNIWSAKYNTENMEEQMDDTALRAKDTAGNDIPEYSAMASGYLSNLPFKQRMVDINGTMAKALNMREVYKNNGGIVLNNGYVAGIYGYTSTDYEIQQITELKAYLDERGIQLLYVNEPTKYIDDRVIAKDLGVNTYINDNTDRFLSRLEENEIHYLDLRAHIVEENLDSFNMFYKTDHHWTTQMGKLAAEAIAEELNYFYGYNIDLSLYDSDRFSYQEYEDAWLGEQGKKLGKSFVGLDDFTFIAPDYDTSFNVSYGGNVITGAFDQVLVNQTTYLPENNENIYTAPSWHYSYMGISGTNGTTVGNLNNTEGKRILILGDSYEQITIPFLALGVSQVQCLILRGYEGSLREYIDTHEIDTVVIAYASFMIGAHDNEASANYAMFDFQ
ncbi:MAG: hypothetical protein HFH13_13920 [Dorea sp.]|nr:hypothetical protein [Dorea sp.]